MNPNPVPAADVLRIDLPPLGAPWRGQGGVYMGMFRAADGERALIAYDGDAGTTEGPWGEYGRRIEGADSTTDGLANTRAMAAAGSEIAKWALGLARDGHKDFYIPSQRELALCWINGDGVFSDDWHWSSTQDSASYAWVVYFANGNQYWGGKDGHYRVRAVRSFVLR